MHAYIFGDKETERKKYAWTHRQAYACLAEHICPSKTIASLRCSQRRKGHRGIRRSCRKLDLLGWVQLIHPLSSCPPAHLHLLLSAAMMSFPQDICLRAPSPTPPWLAISPLYPVISPTSLYQTNIKQKVRICSFKIKQKKLLSSVLHNHRSSLGNKKTVALWCSENPEAVSECVSSIESQFLSVPWQSLSAYLSCASLSSTPHTSLFHS